MLDSGAAKVSSDVSDSNRTMFYTQSWNSFWIQSLSILHSILDLHLLLAYFILYITLNNKTFVILVFRDFWEKQISCTWIHFRHIMCYLFLFLLLLLSLLTSCSSCLSCSWAVCLLMPAATSASLKRVSWSWALWIPPAALPQPLSPLPRWPMACLHPSIRTHPLMTSKNGSLLLPK